MYDSDLLVLVDLVQSHTTLEVLELLDELDDEETIGYVDKLDDEEKIGYETDLVDDPTLTNLPQLMEIADNSRLKLIVEEGYYKYLPDEDDIDEQHDENDDNDGNKD